MKKFKYHAETVEQFKIMAWIKANFHDEGLAEIHLVDRNHVRIHDRDGGMAILTYIEGEVSLREIYQAC
ncbi:MAG TPA: hypothetical protein VN421_09630 [Pseudoflavonifractor sp.]|nr:hypothetical protein [Pseudoflavonifractor sp.]